MTPLLAFAAFNLRAAVFGVVLLGLILVTAAVWKEGWAIHRYDFLFVAVLAVQGWLLGTGRETWAEARVIVVFHAVGVLMEIFKTSVGSWVYPEPAVLAFPGLEFTFAGLEFSSSPVPLFTGFMYSAVGSYIARAWRLSGLSLEGAPPQWMGGLLAVAIYANFYVQHVWQDIRLWLFAGCVLLYARCFAVFGVRRWPILPLFFMAALAVYGAENLGSVSGTWLYPNQHEGWEPVRIAKLGSWFLLMFVSFSLVRLVRGEERRPS